MISSTQDPEVLLVEHLQPMIMAKQYEPFVIPCKPTSPKVKVELIHEQGEVNVTSYNEMIGFTCEVDYCIAASFEISCDYILNDTWLPDYATIDCIRRSHFPLVDSLKSI
jgi:hypothetical protein